MCGRISFYICVIIVLIETDVYAVTNKFYKVSMVASVKKQDEPAQFEHAASPVWDGQRNSLLFVDVWKQTVHQLDYTSGDITSNHIEYGPVQLVTTVADSKRLLVAVRASLYLLDLETGGDAGLRPLTAVDHGLPDNVIHIGRADHRGNFWMGTQGLQTGDEVSPDGGSLYSVSKTGLSSPHVHLRPVWISGGITWALNNSVLYFADSATQKIEAFDFDADKEILSGRRTIIDVTAYGYDTAKPAGMTIDSNGNIWVALMLGGAVLHVDPDKRHVIHGYKLPVSRCNDVAWGGPGLDELFVTTSKRGASNTLEPLAGAIFTLRDTGSTGLPHHHFVIDNPDVY